MVSTSVNAPLFERVKLKEISLFCLEIRTGILVRLFLLSESSGRDSTLMPYCCHPPTRKVNDSSSSVNICFVDAHVEMRKKSEIPISSTNVFWTGLN